MIIFREIIFNNPTKFMEKNREILPHLSLFFFHGDSFLGLPIGMMVYQQ